MTYDRVPRRGWVLVCDGSKSLLLHNEGNAERPDLKLIDAGSQDTPPARDLGTDRPGRSNPSVGGAGSAMEQADRHLAVETAFLTRLAGRVDRLMQEHGVESLTLVAPPKALGQLRGLLLPATRACITGELAKDLTHLPVAEIGRHLAL